MSNQTKILKQKAELLELLEYLDLFVKNPKKPPEARLVSHVINTGNCQHVRSKIVGYHRNGLMR